MKITLPLPSGVGVSFLRPELEGARLVGPCWCSGDFTMADIIICCRAVGGFVELPWSLYCRAGLERLTLSILFSVKLN